MTAAEMSRYIGRKGTIRGAGDLKFEIEVVDVKQRWGIVRFEVRPIAGFGRAWVEQVEFPPTPKYTNNLTFDEIVGRG